MQYPDILIKLRKIIRSINLESKKIEKEYGISIPQLLCLQYLSECNDYIATASEIKGYMNLNASTISGIIKRLEVKGLLARLPNLKDKRSSYITLTAKGAETIKHSPLLLHDKINVKLSKLDDDIVNELDRNIDLLIKILDAQDIDAGPIITTAEL